MGISDLSSDVCSSDLFSPAGQLPFMHEILGWLGFEVAPSPLNLSAVWAAICCFLVWIFIWHTRWGYAMRTVGANETAAVYAGIDPRRITLLALCLSGTLAGFLGINEVMGVPPRLLLNFTPRSGFTGHPN